MFKLDEAISRWRQQLAAGGIKAPELLEELESHLRDEVDAQMRAGLNEQQAFDAAVQRIGEGKTLRREFRKLNRVRDNPLWLNILAVWLIVTGLSNLNLRGLLLHLEWSLLPMLLGVGLTILGVGLLHRNNISRLCAIGWFAFLLIGSVIFMAKHGLSGSGYVYTPSPASSGTIHYQVFGLFSAPYPVFYAVVLFNTAMWFVGLFLLTKPSIRKVFRQILLLFSALTCIAFYVRGWRHAGQFQKGLSNLSPSGKQTLQLACEEAPRLHHNFIGTEHVLLGLTRLETGTVANVMKRLGLTRDVVLREVEQFVGGFPAQEAILNIPYTPRVRKAILLATKEAKTLHHDHIGGEDILLGLLLEGDGIAARVLKRLGVQIEKTREAILTESAL